MIKRTKIAKKINNEKLKMKNELIRTYEPDNVLKQGYFHIFKEIFTELGRNRWLIYQLFKRDILAIYKQSFFGIFWAVFFPVLSIGTFMLLNRSGLFVVSGISVPYPVVAIIGMSIWQIFSSGLIASSNSLVKAGRMITKINFSKKSLVLASFGQSLIAFIVQLLLTISLLFYFGITPHWSIVLLPFLIIPVLLLTFGIGLLLSILNGIARDTANLVSVFMTFFLFLTPVLYKKPDTGFLSVISEYNPIYYLITFPRELILQGKSTELYGFLISTLISIFIFLLCLFFFHLAETRVTERI